MDSPINMKIRVAGIANANPKVKAAMAAFDETVKAATLAKKELADSLKDTPEWRLLQASGGEPSVGFDRYGSIHITSTYRPDWTPSPEPLAPQTLNALITGKLLTDDEKRQLLVNQGIRLTKPEQRAKPEGDGLVFASFDDEIPF